MEFRRQVTDSLVVHPLANLGGRGRYRAPPQYGLAREGALWDTTDYGSKVDGWVDWTTERMRNFFPKRGKKYEDTSTKIVMKELKNFWILAQMFGVYTVRLNLGHFIRQLSVVTFSRLYEGKVTATCT